MNLTQLLIALGAALGTSLDPGLSQIIAVAVAAANGLIADLTTGKGGVAGPVFLTVLQAAFGVLTAEGKLTADQSAALSKAITDTIAADQQSQVVVDPSTLTPIAPLGGSL